MKFCYGTFQAVMDVIKRLTEVWKLRDLIAHPLDPEYFIGDRAEQNKLSDLARGESDLPGIMVENACNKDPREIAKYFRDKVLNCLRSEMFQLAILVLKDIIERDSIGDDEVVEVVSGMTKRDFLDCKAFVPYRTFAGLFIFAVRRNNNAGCKPDVDAIKRKDYFYSFLDKKAEITIIKEDDDSVTASHIAGLLTEMDASLLRSQSGRLCPVCNLPYQRKDAEGEQQDYFDYIRDDARGIHVAVCRTCKPSIQGKPDRIAEYALIQKRKQESFKLIDIASPNSPVKNDLMRVLAEISQMDEPESGSSVLDPKTIEEKISTEKMLCRKVKSLIIPAYREVDLVLNRLSGSNAINKDRLRMKIRHMWESMQWTNQSRSQEFNALVETLDNRSGHQYHEACEVLLAYYIQGCDVFAPPR